MVSKTIDVGSIPTAPVSFISQTALIIDFVSAFFVNTILCHKRHKKMLLKRRYQMKNILKKIYPAVLVFLLIFLDQAVKLLAAGHLKGQPDYPLLSGILEFSYLENTGAAFSSFMGKQGFLITLTTCAMLFLILKYWQIPKDGMNRYLPMKASLLLIISGGIGNLIDRIKNGYVIDFIYFVPIDFPKFNIADCYVCIGMAVFAYLCFFYYKDEELDFLFTLKRK